ncbi:hypothetical protein FKM82_030298 [Ascaphus truei]
MCQPWQPVVLPSGVWRKVEAICPRWATARRRAVHLEKRWNRCDPNAFLCDTLVSTTDTCGGLISVSFSGSTSSKSPTGVGSVSAGCARNVGPVSHDVFCS